MSARTSKQEKWEKEVRRIREKHLRRRLANRVPEHTGMLSGQDWGNRLVYGD